MYINTDYKILKYAISHPISSVLHSYTHFELHYFQGTSDIELTSLFAHVSHELWTQHEGNIFWRLDSINLLQ
jgi:hypothetical protein